MLELSVEYLLGAHQGRERRSQEEDNHSGFLNLTLITEKGCISNYMEIKKAGFCFY